MAKAELQGLISHCDNSAAWAEPTQVGRYIVRLKTSGLIAEKWIERHCRKLIIVQEEHEGNPSLEFEPPFLRKSATSVMTSECWFCWAQWAKVQSASLYHNDQDYEDEQLRSQNSNEAARRTFEGTTDSFNQRRGASFYGGAQSRGIQFLFMLTGVRFLRGFTSLTYRCRNAESLLLFSTPPVLGPAIRRGEAIALYSGEP